MVGCIEVAGEGSAAHPTVDVALGPLHYEANLLHELLAAAVAQGRCYESRGLAVAVAGYLVHEPRGVAREEVGLLVAVGESDEALFQFVGHGLNGIL